MNEEIFKNLNARQVEAVRATEGMVRVVAGAGSGKTRVLTNRYAYLVEHLGIDPANVLCMTFTNKAAQEMRQRIRQMVAVGAASDFICTIHGLCVKILRREIYRLGYPRNFMIVDVDDCKELMKQVMEELELTRKELTANQLLDNVGVMKATVDYVPFLTPGGTLPANADSAVLRRYLELQRKSFALDFDDLIYFTLHLFRHFPDVLDHWQQQFDYVQVDEVQDCSATDWEIIDALSARCGNLFIVGDPDQAIYEWRGAKPDRFVAFKADTDIVLDENYRSTPNILNVANSVIRNNRNRVAKDLRTNIPADAVVVHKHATDEAAEGRWITSMIGRMMKTGCRPSDFAVLYRTSNMSRFVEQALMNAKLPYTLWGGVRFFERKEVKDCIAYMRLVQWQDDISFARVVNVPSRKFGDAKMTALRTLAQAEGRPLFDTLMAHIGEKPFKSAAMADFVAAMQRFMAMKDSTSISDLLDTILNETGLAELYRKDGDEDRIENINELVNSIKYYESANEHEEISLETYLQDIALFTNSDYNKEGATVKLMTIHQAKGLEFPYVFVVGLTEGLFPSHRTVRERKQNGLEEERRLMYVAVTRAEKALFLTESEGFNYATKSSKFPSRFISEIGSGLVRLEGYIDPYLLMGRDSLISAMNIDLRNSTADFGVGDMVSHKSFGDGVVLSINKDSKSCLVAFGNKTRNILWRFLQAKE